MDENQKVKTITALTIAALAEASAPYGIESFDDVLEPLWKGIRLLRGKVGRQRQRQQGVGGGKGVARPCGSTGLPLFGSCSEPRAAPGSWPCSSACRPARG